MKFELNDYHHNISDEEFLEDIRQAAKKAGKNTLSSKEYLEFGNYHWSTISRRFGGWNAALQLAGLDIVKAFNRNSNNINVSDEDLINDVNRVCKELGVDTITTADYDKYGKHGRNYLCLRFGSWENVLLSAGLKETGYHHSVSTEELLDDLERVWIKLGRQPTSNDIRNGISKYSLSTYIKHFGSWRNALIAFVNYINSDDQDISSNEEVPQLSEIKDNKKSYRKVVITPRKTNNHKTQREPNLRLRFIVMQRDNFKCCACGASPAKDPSVELHIDHIVPWSKGGETTIENLQTLCSKCNLGKSDLL